MWGTKLLYYTVRLTICLECTVSVGAIIVGSQRTDMNSFGQQRHAVLFELVDELRLVLQHDHVPFAGGIVYHYQANLEAIFRAFTQGLHVRVDSGSSCVGAGVGEALEWSFAPSVREACSAVAVIECLVVLETVDSSGARSVQQPVVAGVRGASVAKKIDLELQLRK